MPPKTTNEGSDVTRRRSIHSDLLRDTGFALLTAVCTVPFSYGTLGVILLPHSWNPWFLVTVINVYHFTYHLPLARCTQANLQSPKNTIGTNSVGLSGTYMVLIVESCLKDADQRTSPMSTLVVAITLAVNLNGQFCPDLTWRQADIT